MNDTTLDLDGLIVEPVEFKLLGVTRVIKPIDLASMLKFTNSMSEIGELATKKDASSKEILEAYYSIFTSCIEPFSMDDLKAMSTAQLMSLYALMLRRIYGEDLAETYGQKKKTKVSQPSQLESQPKRSWLKRVFFSDGSLKSA